MFLWGAPHAPPPKKRAHTPAAEPTAEGTAELRDHRQCAHAVDGVVVALHVHQMTGRERQLGQLLVVEEVVGLRYVSINQLPRSGAKSLEDRTVHVNYN